MTFLISWRILLIVFLVALAIFVLWFLINAGYFQKLDIQERVFPGGHCIYVEYQGPYSEMGGRYSEITKALDPFLQAFPGTQSITIYYDEQESMKDPRKCRAIIGILIPDEYTPEEISSTIEDVNQEIKYRHFPEAACISVSFPHTTILGFALKTKKVLKGMKKYLQSKYPEKKGPFISLYNWGPFKEKMTEITIFPNPSLEEYAFSTQEECPPSEAKMKRD